MEYLTSSHRAQWVLSAAALAERRLRCLDEARETALEALQIERRLQAEAGKRAGEALPEILSGEEEATLVRQFQVRLREMAEKMGLPRQVVMVALLFFKRFYVLHSTLDHQPGYIVAACLMSAIKSEECTMFQGSKTPFSVSRFLDSINGPPAPGHQPQRKRLISADELVRQEAVLMDGLGFTLMAYTPLHALEGALRHCKHALRLTEVQLRAVRDNATACCQAAMLTDAPLLLHVGELALLSVKRALGAADLVHRVPQYLAEVAMQASEAQRARREDLDRMWATSGPFVTSRAPAGSAGGVREESCDVHNHVFGVADGVAGEGEDLEGRLDFGEAVLEEGMNALERDKAINMRALIDKLNSCRNPGTNPASLLFKQRRQQEKDEKSLVKRKKRKAGADAGLGDDE